VTGFDILFFWVARMIMMGLKFMGRHPFNHVYIHALIRDADGQKMSKSKGNVVDPLKLTEAYGTDAVRFTLAAYAAQGRDIKFSEKRVEGYRLFLNKIWNVSRFISMNVKEGEETLSVHEIIKENSHITPTLADRWILSRLSGVCEEVNDSLEDYRFNDVASILYQFVWHELCDWYVELIKPELYGENADAKLAALSILIHVYEVSLALMHPFMPFITEEIWQQLHTKKRAESLCIRKYPRADEGVKDTDAEEEMGVVMDAVTGIRSIRGELNISPSLELKAMIRTSDRSEEILKENFSHITSLARTKDIEIGRDIEPPKNTATSIKPTMEIFVPLKGLIDIDAEINRLSKEVKKAEKDLLFIKKKLANEDFISKAPQTVVEENRLKHSEYLEKIKAVQSNIDKLKELAKGE
jgi:valyl-tRNA synthetase